MKDKKIERLLDMNNDVQPNNCLIAITRQVWKYFHVINHLNTCSSKNNHVIYILIHSHAILKPNLSQEFHSIFIILHTFKCIHSCITKKRYYFYGRMSGVKNNWDFGEQIIFCWTDSIRRTLWRINEFVYMHLYFHWFLLPNDIHICLVLFMLSPEYIDKRHWE